MKLLIIHPGIQHSPRLANGASRSGLFEKVTLLTSILFKPSTKIIGLLKRRIKPIDKEVKIVNHYLYTFLYSITKALHNKLIVNPKNQSHNNPIYFWQQVFGYLCLPHLYFNRKNLLVICFETTGWPIVKYCKKWNIPLIMDFASISHEKAKTLGINETQYGINLKIKERALIDYGFYCSDFCRKSFEGLTSAKKDFVLYLGAEGAKRVECKKLKVESEGSESQVASSDSYREKNQDTYGVENLKETRDVRHETQDLSIGIRDNNLIKISFIANLEYRKGLDIFLESIYSYDYPAFLEVHLIGRIREEWVNEHKPAQIINQNIKLVYQPAMSQSGLFAYLKKEAFDLNVQCSRFDSFAMVVPETMMQGIPNVVSPFVGAGEMLRDGVDGFIMDKLSAECLASVISKYINLPIELKKCLEKNVLETSKRMTWSNYYQNLTTSLKSILNTI